MEPLFIPVKTGEDIAALAAIANEVWHQHFASILSPEQIDYMVERFQSVPAVTGQLANEGYEYYFIRVGEKNIGYAGIKPEAGKLFLSKLYILYPYRGNGFASRAFEFMEGICRERRLRSIWLTVNRYNTDTIAVYQKKGFKTIRTQVADIGNGFVMDDYIMEKTVEPLKD